MASGLGLSQAVQNFLSARGAGQDRKRQAEIDDLNRLLVEAQIARADAGQARETFQLEQAEEAAERAGRPLRDILGYIPEYTMPPDFQGPIPESAMGGLALRDLPDYVTAQQALAAPEERAQQARLLEEQIGGESARAALAQQRADEIAGMSPLQQDFLRAQTEKLRRGPAPESVDYGDRASVETQADDATTLEYLAYLRAEGTPEQQENALNTMNKIRTGELDVENVRAALIGDPAYQGEFIDAMSRNRTKHLQDYGMSPIDVPSERELSLDPAVGGASPAVGDSAYGGEYQVAPEVAQTPTADWASRTLTAMGADQPTGFERTDLYQQLSEPERMLMLREMLTGGTYPDVAKEALAPYRGPSERPTFDPLAIFRRK